MEKKERGGEWLNLVKLIWVRNEVDKDVFRDVVGFYIVIKVERLFVFKLVGFFK